MSNLYDWMLNNENISKNKCYDIIMINIAYSIGGTYPFNPTNRMCLNNEFK